MQSLHEQAHARVYHRATRQVMCAKSSFSSDKACVIYTRAPRQHAERLPPGTTDRQENPRAKGQSSNGTREEPTNLLKGFNLRKNT